MSLSLLIPALILGLLAVVLIAAIAHLLLLATRQTSIGRFLRPGIIERARFNRATRLFSASETLFRQSSSVDLSKLVHEIFFLEPIRSDPSLIERTHQHHLLILEKLMDRADQQTTRMPSLPIIEDLIGSRAQLLRAYFDIRAKNRNLKKRRWLARERTPKWAITETNKKVNEISERLETNRRSLLSQLDELIRAFSISGQSEESVTYH